MTLDKPDPIPLFRDVPPMSPAPRVLIAFDKFKDSLTAEEACAITSETLHATHPDWSLDPSPLADGGEGFASILTRATGGELRTVRVTGPRGAPISATFGLVRARQLPIGVASSLGLNAPDRTLAILDMASASGLALLPPVQRDAWHTSSRGTGELIATAVDAGAEAILLGVGGSATSDLGLGALGALGLRALDEEGEPCTDLTPAHWTRTVRFDGQLRTVPPLFIACDVTNPLVGPQGAAAVYGPQKGLQPADITRFDAAADRIGDLLCAHFNAPLTRKHEPGAGAAGGVAFGLRIAVGAELRPGLDLVAQWLQLDARIRAADIVITGEGRFDESSLQGKGPGALATRAIALGKRVYVFAGQVTATDLPAGVTAHAISAPTLPLTEAFKQAPALLATTVRAVFTP